MRWIITAFLALTLGCSASEQRHQLPFLADQYGPTMGPNSKTRKPTPQFTVDGETRIHKVVAPDGKMYALKWLKLSNSRGTPQSGQLQGANRIPKRGIGFRHVGKNPFGTDETVMYLQYAAWAVNALYPGTAPVIIGDLSGRYGGHLPPHKSHQSGRDADIGLYMVGNKPLRHFKTLSEPMLDAEKTWTFIEALLRTGRIKYIFLDRKIQKQLFDHALSEGWPRETLNRLFQYPGNRRRAVIRHVRSHKNHIHVRFKCPTEDTGCRG